MSDGNDLCNFVSCFYSPYVILDRVTIQRICLLWCCQ